MLIFQVLSYVLKITGGLLKIMCFIGFFLDELFVHILCFPTDMHVIFL